MINVIITYKVAPRYVEPAQQLIEEFVSGVNLHEPGTLYYYSYQDKEEAGRFTHVMAFSSEEAQELHRKSPHCVKFVEQLYPLCEEEPHPITVRQVASKPYAT